MSMTQPRTGPAPIIRIERDEHSVATAKAHAAPRPPRTASIAHVYRADGPGASSPAPGGWHHQGPGGGRDTGHGPTAWARGRAGVRLDPSRSAAPRSLR